MKILSSDPSHFAFIKDFPFAEHFTSYNGIKMHYIDEGDGETILALHGEPSWCYLYRKFVPILSKNYRFIAPDFIGFGKSDKMIGREHYTFEFHFDSIVKFIHHLDLHDITLVVQDWGGLIGLSVLGEFPERFKRVVIMNTFLPIGKKLPLVFKTWQFFSKHHPDLPVGWIMQTGTYNKLSKEVLRAYKAPFPNKKYKDGAKAFPSLVPSHPGDPGVDRMKKARETLSKWDKPALVLFSDKDPLMSRLAGFFYHLIPTSNQQKKITIRDAGHFLQEEKGEEIAEYILIFMNDGLMAPH